MLNNNNISNLLFKSSKSETRTSIIPTVAKNTNSTDVANIEARQASEGYQKLVDALDDYQISALSFGLLSDADVERLSVTNINRYDKGNESNCVNSKAMGSTSIEDICVRCKLRFPNCNGHFGDIDIPTPIIHPLLKKELVKVLSVVCRHCCGLRITDAAIQSSGLMKIPASRRLHEFAEKVKDEMPCPRCKRVNQAIATGEHNANRIHLKGNGYIIAEDIRTLLNPERLTYEQVKIMGYENGSHPYNIIISKLLVIPPIHRPNVTVGNREKYADLTDAYSAIIRACTEYSLAVESQASETEKNTKLEKISNTIHDLFTNPDTGSGKDPKGIMEAFKGKKSVVRQGRRTNNNARTVLGPAPTNAYGVLSMPTEQAKVLLREERIHQYNKSTVNAHMKKMKELIALGKVDSIKLAGSKFKTKITDSSRWKYIMELKNGDTIYRHTMDGDVVIFNRQPTLQKESMAGYKVEIRDQRTIGLPLPNTTQHNADFDGDEGNIFGVVSLQAAAEVEHIMGTWNNIISSQSARPNAGLVMNALSAGYALTADDVLVNSDLFYDCAIAMDQLPEIKPFLKRAIERGLGVYRTVVDSITRMTVEDLNQYVPDYMDGRILFSIFLPPTLQYRKGNVTISDGIIENGQITKDHIGTSHGSIVQVIYSDYGSTEASRFITNATKVLDIYAYRRGISVGIFDYCPWIGNDEKKNALERKRREVISTLRGKIAELPLPNKCDVELTKRYENKIVEHMERATNDIGITVLNQFTDKNSGISIMANSGAKGSSVNAAHTTGMIGPQYDRGERLALCITNGARTTPYVVPGDDDISARGFITSNYSEGVTPLDAASACVATRNAVVATAVGVAISGYLTRRLVRYTEDVTTSFNGAVVINASKTVGKITTRQGMEGKNLELVDVKRTVSLIYGDDNYDTTNIELISTPIGSIFFPVDVQRVALRLNARYGVFDKSYNSKATPYVGPIVYED